MKSAPTGESKITSKIFPSPQHRKAISKEVSYIFALAKKADEAEYFCSIKYFLDINSLHSKTPGKELLDTINETTLLAKEGIKGNVSIKILSYVYCQVFESENWLDLMYNLINIIKGNCAAMRPFKKEITDKERSLALKEIQGILANSQIEQAKIQGIKEQLNRVLNPFFTIQGKINKIVELAEEAKLSSLAQIFKFLYVNDFRNDFTHSHYVIYKGVFNLFKANRSIQLEPLIELITSALNLYANIGAEASNEFEGALKSGKKLYKGKCGTVSITDNKDGTITHESSMKCANF